MFGMCGMFLSVLISSYQLLIRKINNFARGIPRIIHNRLVYTGGGAGDARESVVHKPRKRHSSMDMNFSGDSPKFTD